MERVYWRNRHRYLRLEGVKRVTPEGKEEVSFSGVSWFEHSSNGRHKEENPLGGTIYQAESSPGNNGRGGNGRIAVDISKELKVPASVD